MAFSSPKHAFLLSLALLFIALHSSLAADADILSDFVVPRNQNNVNSTFFTYTGLRSFIGAKPTTLTAYKATMAELPALNGQSVSYVALYYPPGSVNPPHTHPRASELLFLVLGSLEVGFVDTKNHLFTQTLQPSDMFMFPKGLLHYQYNGDGKTPAIAISAFGSAGTGTVSIPGAVFNGSICDPVLAALFDTDVQTIQKPKNAICSSRDIVNAGPFSLLLY